jgi:hypothetical protein
VAGLLRLLAAEGFYAIEDLAPGLAIAEQAAVELPRCAVRANGDTCCSCAGLPHLRTGTAWLSSDWQWTPLQHPPCHSERWLRWPACASDHITYFLQLLGAYLPGPLNVVKDVLLTKQDEPQVGTRIPAACSGFCSARSFYS